MSTKPEFLQSDQMEPHKDRTKAILKAHPEVRTLIGRNPKTALFITGIVALQLTIAVFMNTQPWWLLLLAAYFVGAFANHGLYVLIHDASHNLIFKKRAGNMIMGILADLPNVVPGSASFRRYHLKHHSFQGIYDLDADLPNRWEARLIGNSTVGKAVWLLLFPIFQILRPPRLKEIKFTSGWNIVNMIVVFSFDIAIFMLVGPKAFFYLMFSLFFSIGLHPLGARWIQEHYLVDPPQETYSYYGPLNKIAFNVGHHNEHHDFPSIPWNRLPELRAMAPEYYNTLTYHTSWTRLLIQFLRDADLSLFSRVERTERGGVSMNTDPEKKHAMAHS